ncbi:hypothetical protein GRI62_12240 [Erythrobacter arachoides]|uniref:PRC-barrel protein n=1 Tax=Aurantiacibacter arachoides TaxID=1850444 RepID=A0A845A5D2_9SPHN|nr:hypothetical protein [Aurantiacibacter arachoides]MXO94366.1 hypothetical protein [Aurantiacibacter arachoides]GGD64016.1 hypothetical protein GCM10011411_25410 [Aurantiacibacter arachoides]
MLDVLQWYGAIAAVVAAGIVATDVSRRVTGWAFVLFVTASIALIAWGFLGEDAEGIGWQNVCLLGINLWGVYRYLLRSEPPEGRKTSSQVVR